MSLFTLAVTLFLIMDPIGNVSTFLTLVQGVPPKRRLLLLTREMAIVLAMMVLFYFIGEAVFSVLDLAQSTVSMMTGIVLFIAAILILFPTVNSPRANLPAGEPFITPLAIPFLAGPSLLASILLFSHITPYSYEMLVAIFCAWAAAFLVLLAAPTIKRFLGENGLMAAERLMAMVLVMLAIQRFLEGVQLFVGQCRI